MDEQQIMTIENQNQSEQLTQLNLTDEQKPRFVEAAAAGKPLPEDIVESFMSQLFDNDSH